MDGFGSLDSLDSRYFLTQLTPKRRKKRVVSAEFVNNTLSSNVRMCASSYRDVSPESALFSFKVLCNDIISTEALITTIQKWKQKYNSDIFDGSLVGSDIMEKRLSFVKTLNNEFKANSFTVGSAEFDLCHILQKNPENGLRLCAVVSSMADDESSSVSSIKEAIDNLKYSEEQGIHLPEPLFHDGRKCSNPGTSNYGKDKNTTTHSTPVPSTRTSLERGNSSSHRPLDSPILAPKNKSYSGFNPLADTFSLNDTFSPQFNSTLSQSPAPTPDQKPVLSFPHFSKEIVFIGNGFPRLDFRSLSNDDIHLLHKQASDDLDCILKVQRSLERISIKELHFLAKNKSLTIPSPRSNFPEFTDQFLSESFVDEPMPGLYLPGSSNLTYNEAMDLFKEKTGASPSTIVRLNEFIFKSFPLPHMVFNPEVHTMVLPYSPLSGNNFYQKFGLPIEPPSNDLKIRRVKPYNWESARMKLNINYSLMKPLVKYMCNPLLTTLPFHEDLWPTFNNRCIDSPDLNGKFVCRSRVFTTIKPPRLTEDYPINICAFCKGLTLLDGHRMNFVYFVPNGLKYATSEIIDVWKTSKVTICSVHFLH